jgi:hypothetical protein
MAVTAHASGTHTSDGTETFVSSPNVAGVFVFMFELDDMVAGDHLEARVYAMILTGTTALCVWRADFDDVQPADQQIAVSVPISTELAETNALRFSLKGTTTSGTISVPWKVLKHA